MKTSPSKKIATIAVAIALAAATLVSGPVSVANAAPSSLAKLPPLNASLNFMNNGASETSDPVVKVSQGMNLSVNLSAIVPFGAVAVGDVLKMSAKAINQADGKTLIMSSSGGKKLLDPSPRTGATQFSTLTSEIIYTHVVTAADVTNGTFTNFGIGGRQSTANNVQFGFNVRATSNVTVSNTVTFTKNDVEVRPTVLAFFYFRNFGLGNAESGFELSSGAAEVLQQIAPVDTYTSACVDMSEVLTGEVIDVNYSLSAANGQPVKAFAGQSRANTTLEWSTQSNFSEGNIPGTSGFLNSQAPNNQSVNSTGSFSLPPATQIMLNGLTTSSVASKALTVNFSIGGLSPEAGRYEFNFSANVKGKTKDLTVRCAVSDVVNLNYSRTADSVDITFQEPGNGIYDLAGFRQCNIRLKDLVDGQPVYVGGVPAVEVTPATSPRSFKCAITNLELGIEYKLVMFGSLSIRAVGSTQSTFLTFKAGAQVATDARAEAIGIGQSTNETAFDSDTYSYSVTSTDSTTAYPTVIPSNSNSTVVVKLGGVVVAKPNNLNLVTGKNVVTVEITSPSGAKKTYTYTVNKVDTAADATLKSLSFGSENVSPAFESSTISYSAAVSSSTATYPFPTVETSQPDATFVVKRGGSVVTGPGALNLVEGPNVFTVEVTAKNGTTKKTYTVTINKAPAAKDATLTALPGVSGVVSSPTFDAEVLSYSGSVSESTKTADLSEASKTISGATTTYKLNGVVVVAPGTLNLRPGVNKLETTVTSSDGSTKRTYTQNITREVLGSGSSTDANEARLAVNPVPGSTYTAADGSKVEGFDSDVSGYTKAVPVNQENLTLNTGGAANGTAVIVNEYSVDGGVTWLPAPSPVPLAAGKTTKIRTTVTNGTGTKVYTTDVTRPALDPTASVGPVEGDGDVAPKGIAGTGKFIASNDSTFQFAWSKSTGKLMSQATGIYTGYIQAKITFVKGGKTFSCTAQFGTLKVMPQKTTAQKAAAMKMKTFKGKQFCLDKTKLDPKTTAPKGGFTKTTFVKIKSMNKTSSELAQEKLALAALKGFSGEVVVQVIRYRAWPTTMINYGDHTGKGGRIPVQIRNTKVVLN